MIRLLTVCLVSSVIGCGNTQEAVETQVEELRVPNVTIGRGTPTGAYFNGKLFLAYRGTDSHIHTLERSGSNFIDRKTTFVSNDGPSLIVYHGKLFLTWFHKDNGHCLTAAKSLNGTDWTGAGTDQRIDCFHRDAPGMVVYQDRLLMFAASEQDSAIDQFGYNESANKWDYFPGGFPHTSIGPSAAVLGNKLVLAAVDGNGEVITQVFDPVTGWQIPNFVGRRLRGHLIAAATPTPSLLLLGSGIGNIGPDQIEFDSTLNGTDMTDLGHIGDTTSERPHGIRADGSSVELVYRGTNSRLYLITVGLPVQ